MDALTSTNSVVLRDARSSSICHLVTPSSGEGGTGARVQLPPIASVASSSFATPASESNVCRQLVRVVRDNFKFYHTWLIPHGLAMSAMANSNYYYESCSVKPVLLTVLCALAFYFCATVASMVVGWSYTNATALPLPGFPDIYIQAIVVASIALMILYWGLVYLKATHCSWELKQKCSIRRCAGWGITIAIGLLSILGMVFWIVEMSSATCAWSTTCERIDVYLEDPRRDTCAHNPGCSRVWTESSCLHARVNNAQECGFLNETNSCRCVWHHYGRIYWGLAPLISWLLNAVVVQPVVILLISIIASKRCSPYPPE